jgi:hypothetical protein
MGLRVCNSLIGEPAILHQTVEDGINIGHARPLQALGDLSAGQRASG